MQYEPYCNNWIDIEQSAAICMRMATALFFYKLRQICDVRSGFPFRSAIDSLPEGDVAVVQMRDIEIESDIQWGVLPHVELPTSRKPEYLCDGDILFTTRGGRNAALAISDLQQKAVTATNLFVLRLTPIAEALPEFIAWQINQPPAQKYLASASTGTRILNVTRPALEQLSITLPPLQIQRQIVELNQLARQEHDLLMQLAANRQQEMAALSSHILSGKVQIS